MWTIEKIEEIYDQPLIELLSKANSVHRQHHDPKKMQLCSLISIKTGGCTEDCKYCAQSSYYKTTVKAQPLMQYEEVLEKSKTAIAKGATRICLGAAWRGVRDGKAFDEILQMVRGICDLGVEVCVTLGMLNASQAKRLQEAGLYAYNHNLDSSRKFYPTIITTRTYDDRLKTLDIIEEAKIRVCCGGILGMGESIEDRMELIHELCKRAIPPESIPINILGPVKGTPLENASPLSIWEVVRLIATVRIVIPKSMIRLSAGRVDRSWEEQALCFFAGANSIFYGEKLLTISNPGFDRDEAMLQLLGFEKMEPFCG